MYLLKTFNCYWVAMTAILGWFLIIHTPPYLRHRFQYATSLDVPFILHLVGVYALCFTCIFNSLVSPSTFSGEGHRFHVWIGRIGLIGGYIGFFFGAYCCWWPWRAELPPLSFSIGITIGGFLQIYAQYKGYTAINRYQSLKATIAEAKNLLTESRRNETVSAVENLVREQKLALQNHIESMISVFVFGCGTPTIIRIAMMFGDNGVMFALFFAIGFLCMIGNLYNRSLSYAIFSVDQGVNVLPITPSGAIGPSHNSVHRDDNNSRFGKSYQSLN